MCERGAKIEVALLVRMRVRDIRGRVAVSPRRHSRARQADRHAVRVRKHLSYNTVGLWQKQEGRGRTVSGVRVMKRQRSGVTSAPYISTQFGYGANTNQIVSTSFRSLLPLWKAVTILGARGARVRTVQLPWHCLTAQFKSDDRLEVLREAPLGGRDAEDQRISNLAESSLSGSTQQHGCQGVGSQEASAGSQGGRPEQTCILAAAPLVLTALLPKGQEIARGTTAAGSRKGPR
eukprot:scaffold831_cov268-Pinguiococcus_pyrenoidosus.AAC.14